MANYTPIPEIQALVPLLTRDVDQIKKEDWQRVKENLKRFNDPHPEVSIVMIARNEERFIFASLASIAMLDTPKRVQFLVVNNNSTDRTQEILDRLEVKSLFEEKSGWAEARQRGLEEAKAEIVITCDSENLYPSTWVDTLSKPLFEDDKVVVTCAQYCFYTFNNEYSPFMQVYQNFRLVNSIIRHPKRPHLNCLGGNMAYKRLIALEAGGYEFGIGRGEDGGLAYRMSSFGELKFVKSKKAYSYSSLRNVTKEGTLWDAFAQRIKNHSSRILENLTPLKQK